MYYKVTKSESLDRLIIEASSIHPSFMKDIIPGFQPMFLDADGNGKATITKTVECPISASYVENNIQFISHVMAKVKEFGWKYLYNISIITQEIMEIDTSFSHRTYLFIRGC